MRSIFRLLAAFSASMFLLTPATAQSDYPREVVKLVVPFAAGGSTDLLARSIAERLGELWGQSVIVENRPGAGGIIGTEAVARSKGDGYTLVLGTVSTHAVADTLYPKRGYDIQRDLAPITELVTIPQILSVHPSLPVKNLQEFVKYAKERPGQVAYNGSIGTTPHMSMALLASRAKLQLLGVAYKGSAPAMNDLVGGQLHASFDVMMTTLPYLKAGKLRALAVTSAKRSPLAREIPTVAESGFPGYESDVWFGLFAPAGTPPKIVEKISRDAKRAMTDPKLASRLEGAGFVVVGSTPTEFALRIKNDIVKWRKVIVENNIKVE